MAPALADEYERQARWRHFTAALTHLPLTPVPLLAPRVLDVGCGVGTMTALLADAGANAVGLDAAWWTRSRRRRIVRCVA